MTGQPKMDMSADETAERSDLGACLSSIAENLTGIGKRLEAYARDIQDAKSHMWDARRDKHLLIDEMQDYTPVQYAVLSRLFKCRKTIPGDAAQSVSPYSGSTAEEIQRILRPAVQVKLARSYRSSWEIMRLALGIAPNAELVPMERHGEPPEVSVVRGRLELVGRLRTEVDDFRASEHRSLAIIAKTQNEATKLHRELRQNSVDAVLLDIGSTSFSNGVVVCSAHLAKGLEFDRVIVPDASAANYSSELDRNLLYIACTRAMHRLTVLSPKPLSQLLPRSAADA